MCFIVTVHYSNNTHYTYKYFKKCHMNVFLPNSYMSRTCYSLCSDIIILLFQAEMMDAMVQSCVLCDEPGG